MSNIFFNLGLDILMMFLGAIISNVIGVKYFNQNDNLNSQNTLKYTNIQVITKKDYYNNSSTSTQSSDNSSDTLGLFIIFLVISVFAVFLYLRYANLIYSVLHSLSILSLSMLITIIYLIRKNGFILDTTYKSVLYTSIFCLILTQISIYLSVNPIYYNNIDKIKILTHMESNGYLSLLSDFDSSIWSALLYQFMGLIFSSTLLLFQLFALLYFLSSLVSGINDDLNFIWEFIYNHTSKLITKPSNFLLISISLLVISICFTSGVFTYFIYQISSRPYS